MTTPRNQPLPVPWRLQAQSGPRPDTKIYSFRSTARAGRRRALARRLTLEPGQAPAEGLEAFLPRVPPPLCRRPDQFVHPLPRWLWPHTLRVIDGGSELLFPLSPFPVFEESDFQILPGRDAFDRLVLSRQSFGVRRSRFGIEGHGGAIFGRLVLPGKITYGYSWAFAGQSRRRPAILGSTDESPRNLFDGK